MLTARALKSLLREHDLRLTKRLGQHYLVDARIVRQVVEACELSEKDRVIEIGAGLGALTEPLAQRAARVLAIEVDRGVCQVLQPRLAAWPNVQVVCQDALQWDWARAESCVVVGAIPYSITSPLLVSLCEHRSVIQRAILIVQREVADRLLAAPGTKAYGRLSVLGQYFWQIAPVMTVRRHAFFPQPSVDSTCLKLLPREIPAGAVQDEQLLFSVVKAAFAHRRKSLVNCLMDVHGLALERSQAEQGVRALGLPLTIRGEALSIQQFTLLADALRRTN